MTQYKAKSTENLKTLEVNINRLIDRKVDHKDLKSVIDNKADRVDLMEKYALKQEYDEMRAQFIDVVRATQGKLNKD